MWENEVELRPTVFLRTSACGPRIECRRIFCWLTLNGLFTECETKNGSVLYVWGEWAFEQFGYRTAFLFGERDTACSTFSYDNGHD